jgi:hypothetical protein
MATCGRCGSDMKPGSFNCDACGYAANAPPMPPSPDDRYPRRSYDVKLAELVGWSSAQVFEKLGKPDNKWEGNAWNSPEPFDPPITLSRSGEISRAHRFGPALPRIPAYTPYETWQYHNVDGSEWLLYFTSPDASPSELSGSEVSESPKQSRWAPVLQALFGKRSPSTKTSVKFPFRRKRPQIVADVTSYGTGAVF